MNKNDLRYQKTEEVIYKAFLDCVMERGFEQTRVAHLCASAKISRNTFYAHYADKHALLHSICMMLRQDMRRHLDEDTWQGIMTRSFELPVAWCMEAVHRHRELLRVLLRCSVEEVTSMLAQVFIDEPMSRITPHYPQALSRPQVRLCRGYLVSAMFGLIQAWLEEVPETSLEEAKEIMLSMCSASAERFMREAAAL